jgi:hypothetical protein
MSPWLRTQAEALGMHFIPVPRSETAAYQQLDRRVYGVLKARASCKFDQRTLVGESGLINKETPAKLAFLYSEEISTEIIEDASEIVEFRSEIDASGSLADEEAYKDDLLHEGICNIEYRHDDVEMRDIMALDDSRDAVEDDGIVE